MRMVIFDIDGTLADNSHRVHYLYPEGEAGPRAQKSEEKGKRDWDSFFAAQHLDTPREDVVNVLRMYELAYGTNIHIALLTGRGEEHRQVTQVWLREHRIPYNTLTMRKEGDRTDDHIIKLNHIKGWQYRGYQIVGFYEDRKRICDAARAHGITVFQVAEGDF